MGLSFLNGPTSPHVLVSSLNVLSVHVCVHAHACAYCKCLGALFVFLVIPSLSFLDLDTKFT